ncbi:uncharacterized protein MYCFIDRAFT_204345 [Pseudocercospora fijiensis CIRAD86]|uniref:Uncharacterized protein n=1 Tax=Pseudocercospora fijiensis (strain CIRAD86) TaxID=383855 RepID=M2YUY4_PSEFD|nr:uncharacterized protein MYCFIDRAFT_204345 [Pseudocercospora fijiensis CIRAD86]EME81545.1 hypothetical protein MYCFIDRAFT_204345 [Pseudocercospora fijiensis CIRAD86]
MYAALVTANQECRSIEKSFMNDVRHVMRWLPPSYMDSLWTIRVGWDGSPAGDGTKPGFAKLDTTAVSYDSVVRRFSAALQGMKSSGPPANAPDSGQGFSWEVLRTTMRKLQISLEAIEEIFQLTRNHRDRMPLLLHELASAIHLLESVRDVWETSNTRAGASKGKGREVPSTTPGCSSRDFEWSEVGCGNPSPM